MNDIMSKAEYAMKVQKRQLNNGMRARLRISGKIYQVIYAFGIKVENFGIIRIWRLNLLFGGKKQFRIKKWIL